MRRPELLAAVITVALHAPLVFAARASIRERPTAAVSGDATARPIVVAAPQPALASARSTTSRRSALRPPPRPTPESLASAPRPPASRSAGLQRSSAAEPPLGIRVDSIAGPSQGGGGGLVPVGSPSPGDSGTHAAGSPGAEASEPVDASQADVAPRRIAGDEPAYPALAARDGREGVVDVRFIVRADGSVSSPELLSVKGTAAFGRAALEAVRAWRFEPARKDGRAVDCVCTQRLAFRLGRGR